MLSGFDPAWLKAIEEHIQSLERSRLELVTPAEFDLTDLLDEHEHTFFWIRGLADFWSTHSGSDFAQHILDMVIGAYYQSQDYLTLILAGTPQRLEVFLSLGNSTTTQTMLSGMIPGIKLERAPVSNIVTYLRPHFQVTGLLTGIPTHKNSGSGQSESLSETRTAGRSTASNRTRGTQIVSALERVIRGMHGATWAYVVQGYPRPRYAITKDRLKYIDLLAQITSQTHVQVQATQQDSRQKTAVDTGSSTKTFGSEMTNYRAHYLTQLLEREIERLDQASATGQWLVGTYLGAGNMQDARRLASLLSGTLAGKDSRPDPLRAYICESGGAFLTDLDFKTYLSSEEVATLVQLPREEVPGYAIHDFVSFDVDFHAPTEATLPLGHIQQYGRDIHDQYSIALDDLSRHGVVVGVTGSGKTTTIMNLLDHAVKAGKPFLIIEPAKSEYRSLHAVFAGRADLYIYTLGNENVAPFRFNPFEFETNDEPGSASVLSHIDALKAVFNAAFVLYAPMPYVLEMALHEVYEDKGWDLASGLNMRLPKWSERHQYPIFPTLTDLYHKIDTIVQRLGYHDEIERNVKAGLKARIGSMRIGSKGLMLDVARGISMHQLLSTPTLLEMENIGSDDEKTFLMGLILARIYQYRRLQASSGALPTGLQHLIVFEEAHRLLKNTSTQVDDESSNARAQAIDVFTNMLSEIRAYGQGVLVAEQIPGKLAPDVLKNTNLKIVHRLIALDDRESVGQTMNLNTEQMMHLAVLLPGTAAVYAEGADHAYLIHIENYKRKLVALPDAQLKTLSPAYISVASCLAIPDLQRYRIKRSPFGSPDALLYQAADKLLQSPQSRWLWASILIRCVFSPAQLLPMLHRITQQIADEMPYLTANQQEALLRMAIVRGSAKVLDERGASAGWPYPLVEDMRILLTQGLITLVNTNDLSYASADLDRFARTYQDHLQRKQGPYAGCIHCHARCTYRFDVSNLIFPEDKYLIGETLKDPQYTNQADRYAAIGRKVEALAKRWSGESIILASDIGYCGALHMAAGLGLTAYEQTLFGDRLKPHLLP